MTWQSRKHVTLAAVLALSSLIALPPAAAHSVEIEFQDFRENGAENPFKEEVRTALQQIVASGVPGATIRVSNGPRSWTAAAGVATVSPHTPMKASGRFRAGSVTKELVAVAILQLVDRGLVQLDNTVESLLPGLVPTGERISVRQLLNHTSGLFDYASDPAFLNPETYAQKHFTPKELLHISLSHEPTGPPGEKFSYSNTNYILLGLIVESVTGSRLSEVLQERVIAPAGMGDTFLPVDDGHFGGPHSSGYYRMAADAAGSPLHELTYLNPSFSWSSYGLVSTTKDLNRFQQALHDGRLISQDLVREMKRGIDTGNPAYPQYGLGLESAHMPCRAEVWGHTGSIPGFNTLSFTDVRSGVIATISTNAQILDSTATAGLVSAMDALSYVFCGRKWSVT